MSSHVNIPEVLRGVLYPAEAHINRFKKKKSWSVPTSRDRVKPSTQRSQQQTNVTIVQAGNSTLRPQRGQPHSSESETLVFLACLAACLPPFAFHQFEGPVDVHPTCPKTEGAPLC